MHIKCDFSLCLSGIGLVLEPKTKKEMMMMVVGSGGMNGPSKDKTLPTAHHARTLLLVVVGCEGTAARCRSAHCCSVAAAAV